MVLKKVIAALGLGVSSSTKIGDNSMKEKSLSEDRNELLIGYDNIFIVEELTEGRLCARYENGKVSVKLNNGSLDELFYLSQRGNEVVLSPNFDILIPMIKKNSSLKQDISNSFKAILNLVFMANNVFTFTIKWISFNSSSFEMYSNLYNSDDSKSTPPRRQNGTYKLNETQLRKELEKSYFNLLVDFFTLEVKKIEGYEKVNDNEEITNLIITIK